MSATKRAWKLNEFVAHAADVNCLALGHKSGRVLVTGGEDRKVNLWTVGKPNCLMSLTGHTTPVESVKFGHEEEMVVAGSMSGALKAWDLVEAKILRTLTGHKASIKCLEFHPYGDYVASGSMDSNIKLWDIKKKGCIFTYKGHTNSVNCIKFSPDGRWIASAGEDNLIKIWDLTAGKLLHDIKVHSGPVNVVDFNPSELLLASGSSDRTIKFLDLESFQTVCSTDGDSTPVRTIQFHPDGKCLYSGGKDILKVYSWEPAQCCDSVPVNWSEVADIAVAADHKQLIAASFSQTNVSCFVVDLMKVRPTGGIPNQEPFSNSLSSARRSFSSRPPTQSSRQNSVPKEEVQDSQIGRNSPDEDESPSSAEIRDPEHYAAVFNPKKRLDRSPARPVEPFKPPDDEPELPVKQPKQLPKVPSKQLPQKPPPSHKPPVKQTQEHPKISPRQPPEQPKQQPKQSSSATHVIPQKEHSPVKNSVAAEDFLPKVDNQKAFSEDEILSSAIKGHRAMYSVLESRCKNIQIVRAMWSAGNVKTALDSAIGMNDPAVVIDLLNVLNDKPSLYNLDLCTTLLPQIRDLVSSKYESYVQTSCNSVKIILKNLGHVIKGNMQSAPSIGVDISREERHRKCNACYIQLQGIRGILDKRKELHSKLGNVFREIQVLMGGLDN